MKKYFYMAIALMMAMVSCSTSDDDSANGVRTLINSKEALYAIIVPEGAQLTDITSDDYVLTLDNIIAANPETGEFKMQGTEQIDSKAFPIPSQHVIQFYSEGRFLFEAKLNSALSSYLPLGLTFCHFLTDKNGLARYDLGRTTVVSPDGRVEGNPTEQQQEGMQYMYEILQLAGKTSNHIDYDFQY